MFLVVHALLDMQLSTVSEFKALNSSQNMTITLLSDLDFTNVTDFRPVTFVGEFDGKDHTIKNLLIQERNKRNDYQVAGIFDLNLSQYNIIRNLHMSNVTVHATVNTDKLYAGILAGFGQPDCYNITINNSKIITDGLSSRYVGAAIGYIPILKQWCNYTYVRMKNVSATNVTVEFRQLGSSLQHIYGGIVGYTNQKLEVTNSKVSGTVSQTQINQFTVIGGAVGKIGYYASVYMTNVSAYTTMHMQLHKNGVFGNFVGQNQYARRSGCQYCFGGVYGESYHVPVHILAYNTSKDIVDQIVVDYQVKHNKTALPNVERLNNQPSIYVYLNDSSDEKYAEVRKKATLVSPEQRNDTSFYTLLSFLSEPAVKGQYWHHKPHKQNLLPYLDAFVLCPDNLTLWDDAQQRCACIDNYELDEITQTCQYSCPRGENGIMCSGHGTCVMGASGVPECQCVDASCGSPDCNCPACPIGCVCDDTQACRACKENYDNLFNNCDRCARGYSGPTCEREEQLKDTNKSNALAIALPLSIAALLATILGLALGLRKRKLAARKNRLVPSGKQSSLSGSASSGKQSSGSYTGTAGSRPGSVAGQLRLSSRAQQDITRFNDGSGPQQSTGGPQLRPLSQAAGPGHISAAPDAPASLAPATELAGVPEVGSTVPLGPTAMDSSPKRKRVRVKKSSVYDELGDDFCTGESLAKQLQSQTRKPLKMKKLAQPGSGMQSSGAGAHLMPIKRRAANQGPALDVLADE